MATERHGISLSGLHSTNVDDDDVWQRYRDMRMDAQDRMDITELTNTQFVSMLLDVYALHLEDVDS